MRELNWKGFLVGIIGVLGVLGIGTSSAIAKNIGNSKSSFASDRVLVSFRPGTAKSDIGTLHSQVGGRVTKYLGRIGVQVVEVPNGTVLSVIKKYQNNPNVIFAEPNYQRSLFLPATNEGSETEPTIANNFTEQWHLDNSGHSFGAIAVTDPLTLEVEITAPAYTGISNADIDAPESWDITHGSADIKIAILDSGVSCEHVDLDSKCIEQVNFVEDHGSPVDDLVGHGTHVAAIAAAETDNGIGTAGVAWNAKVGSFKVCYEDLDLLELGIISATCDDDDLAEAIIHAADNGYHVINMSIAGIEISTTLENAVNYAWNQGAVLVAGAGNDYGAIRHNPAAYTNVIGVAATDYNDNLASFSTFSTDSDDWVSVAAPGDIIFSAVPAEFCGMAANDPKGCYDWKSGTSMATPVVSGIAAMLWAHLPNATNELVRQRLENSANMTGALGQNFLSWTQHGRVNLHKALTGPPYGENVPPTAGFNSASTGLSVIFTDQSTDSNDNLVSWNWDFGDSSTSIIQNPEHTYATEGTYTVKLTVTDDSGEADTTTHNVAVANIKTKVAVIPFW